MKPYTFCKNFTLVAVSENTIFSKCCACSVGHWDKQVGDGEGTPGGSGPSWHCKPLGLHWRQGWAARSLRPLRQSQRPARAACAVGRAYTWLSALLLLP